MLLIGATITIAIPSKSDRRPVQQVETPFDVEEIVEEVKQHYQPKFQKNEVENHPMQGEFLIDTCIKYIPDPNSQKFPSVAFDGTNYFVVWADVHLNAVVGTRVNQSGEVLDKVGIRIADTGWDWEEGPAIAFGDNYLVVWKDDNANGIFGARVNTYGLVLDTIPIPICTTYYNSYEPAVAYGDSTFMVVWTYYSSEVIFGARVSNSGLVLDTTPIPICTTYYFGYHPSVSFDETNFLVVWNDESDIVGSRVSPAGVILDTLGIIIAHSIADLYEPVVCFGEDNYFIVWTDERNLIDTDIYGARVSIDGVVLDPSGVPVSNAPGSQYSPFVSFGCDNYFVSWTDSRSGFDDDIFGARVNQSGLVLDTAGIVISSAEDNQIYPSVASGVTEYFVFWADERISSDIFGARINPSGMLLDSVGVLISMQCNRQWRPKVAFDGTNYLAVWYDNYASNFDIYGARVNLAGLVIDSVSIPISTFGSNQYYPSVAFDGTNYLVVWQDETVGCNIFGARVNQAGIVLDTNGIAISTARARQYFATVAFDGTNYLVAWQDERNIYHHEIYAVRVNQYGIVLDSNGFLISVGNRDKKAPSVAFDGQNYLVAWEDYRYGRQPDIYCTRVNPDGLVLDTNGIPISTDINSQRYPSVTFDGSNYLLVWADYRSGYEYDIYGARVDTSGVVIDSFPVSTQVGDQTNPAIVHGVGNQALITYSSWTGTVQGRTYNTYRIWGKFAPLPGIEERNTLEAKRLTPEIYPNPAKAVIRVRGSLSAKTIKIFDVSGKLIKEIASPRNDGIGEAKISLKGINPGIYFLRLGKETKKFLVVK